ncbi:MAG: T9SS type A sorting domain-containing protein [candidate division Zixibacteria bacterium]|nr:T9SS type A sorting domain-containing protein [candidate division Zixibacteria bacterium]
MLKFTILLAGLIILISTPASATIINVPGDYGGIQAGINASSDGDTVLVQSGYYFGNINFNGRGITLGSLYLTSGYIGYISSTTIHGYGSGSVMTFDSNEDHSSIVVGFTITGGNHIRGAGIYCENSSPEFRNNIVTNNIAHEDENWNGLGGAFYCFQSDLILRGNVIFSNNAYYDGGAMYLHNSNPLIVNNTFYGNSAMYGGAISCTGSSALTLINNIFWADSATDMGNEFYLSDDVWPLFTYCNIQDTLWPGDGNINQPPLFRDPAGWDFHLMATECDDPYDSPCIDAGDPDILDGVSGCEWGLGESRSDMGAYGGGDSVEVDINDLSQVPDKFKISQSYPNPFNAITTIQYKLPTATNVAIDIFDIKGGWVTSLVNGFNPAGSHRISWDASGYSSGIYLYRLRTSSHTESRKMIFLK